MKANAIAYWLVPAEAEHELFVEIIRILAKQLEAPRFEPHLTICVTLEDARSARRTLKQVAAAPIRLRVRGVNCSNHFAKTLFVRFQRNRALDHLTASLHRAAKMPTGTLRDPHLSLLYKRMPIPAKKHLASAIRLPLTEVAFDSIKVVRCALPTAVRADVEGWEAVATKSLRDLSR